jgi:hypothetical protein
MILQHTHPIKTLIAQSTTCRDISRTMATQMENEKLTQVIAGQ